MKLQENENWREEFVKAINSIRAEVRRRGGITQKEIDEAIQRYRRGEKKRRIKKDGSGAEEVLKQARRNRKKMSAFVTEKTFAKTQE